MGFHVSRDQAATPDATLDDIHDGEMLAAGNTFFGSTLIGANCLFDEVRVYQVGTNGLMEGNGPLIEANPPGGVPGTGSAWKYPTQIALAVTTVAVNRGPAKRGRFYIPAPIRSIVSAGQITATDASDYLLAAQTLLKSCTDAVGLASTADAVGLNISPGPAGSTTGTKQKIDHLEVGRVYDTLRSRRNKLDEARVVGSTISYA